MDDLLRALRVDLLVVKIEADMTHAQPSPQQYAQFAELAEQVDHRLEMVAGLLLQQEEAKEINA